MSIDMTVIQSNHFCHYKNILLLWKRCTGKQLTSVVMDCEIRFVGSLSWQSEGKPLPSWWQIFICCSDSLYHLKPD